MELEPLSGGGLKSALKKVWLETSCVNAKQDFGIKSITHDCLPHKKHVYIDLKS